MSVTKSRRVGGKGAGVFGIGRSNNQAAEKAEVEKQKPVLEAQEKTVEQKKPLPAKPTIDSNVGSKVRSKTVAAPKPISTVQEEVEKSNEVGRITVLCSEEEVHSLDYFLLGEKIKNKLKMRGRSKILKAMLEALLSQQPSLTGCRNYEDVVKFFEDKLA